MQRMEIEIKTKAFFFSFLINQKYNPSRPIKPKLNAPTYLVKNKITDENRIQILVSNIFFEFINRLIEVASQTRPKMKTVSLHVYEYISINAAKNNIDPYR